MSPVLTIYEDGVKREEVQLKEYDNTDALHALMRDKGFHKKGEGGGAAAEGEATTKSVADGGAAKSASQETAAKVMEAIPKGVERIEKKETTISMESQKVTLGNQGEVLEIDGRQSSSGPAHGIGAATGAVATGLVLYYVANNRKKNARSVQ